MLTLCSRPLHATTPSDSGYPPSQGLISAWRKRRGTVLIDDNGRVIRHKRIHHHSDLSSPSTHAPNPSRVPPTPCIPISNETCCYPNAHAMPIANPTTSQEANPVHYDHQSPTYIHPTRPRNYHAPSPYHYSAPAGGSTVPCPWAVPPRQ